MKTWIASLVVVLCASALPATAQDTRGASSVPTPRTLTVGDLPDPYPWGSKIARGALVPLEFSVDLDRLAPLGTTPGNGAVWFADFSKNIGPRISEYEAAQSSTMMWQENGRDRKILPPDHPLLLEAEPAVDQGRWSFYPDVYPWTGPSTPIANLLFALQLGRSWIARGQQATDPERAVEDYRRTVRLGRLLLQDDVTLIQNLIGTHLVRTGVDAIYRQARERGDGATAAFAALVLQDCAVLRIEMTRRFQDIAKFSDFVARIDAEDGSDHIELRLPDDRLAALVTAATEDPSRALRIESTTPLWITSHMGTESQREIAERVFARLVDDPDPLVAAAAADLTSREFDPLDLEAHWGIPAPSNGQ